MSSSLSRLASGVTSLAVLLLERRAQQRPPAVGEMRGDRPQVGRERRAVLSDPRAGRAVEVEHPVGPHELLLHAAEVAVLDHVPVVGAVEPVVDHQALGAAHVADRVDPVRLAHHQAPRRLQVVGGERRAERVVRVGVAALFAPLELDRADLLVAVVAGDGLEGPEREREEARQHDVLLAGRVRVPLEVAPQVLVGPVRPDLLLLVLLDQPAHGLVVVAAEGRRARVLLQRHRVDQVVDLVAQRGRLELLDDVPVLPVVVSA